MFDHPNFVEIKFLYVGKFWKGLDLSLNRSFDFEKCHECIQLLWIHMIHSYLS